MRHISPNPFLLFLLILLPFLAQAAQDQEDLTGKRFPGGSPPESRHTVNHAFGIIQLPYKSKDLATGHNTACADANTSLITLADGVLRDSWGRTGCIVANRQFQFDPPPLQPDALFTGGWSVGKKGLLALGDQTTFYACPCDDHGSSKIYDMLIAEYCFPVVLEIVKLTEC